MDNLSHLRLNLGGALHPDQVFGRDDLLAQIVGTLGNQGVSLVAERRSGKTSVLTLLEHRHPEGMTVLKLSVEGVTSPVELTRRIADVARPHAKPDFASRLVSMVENLGITGVGPVSRQPDLAPDRWKQILRDILEGLADSPGIMVLVLDELPYALQAIAKDGTSHQAREVLDVFREARQNTPGRSLRFIYCGSIGLHHVLKEIRDGSWDPTNDLATITVAPLGVANATRLASALLTNEKVACGDSVDDVAEAIARLSEGVPFYIQSLVGKCRASDTPILAADIDEIFAKAITDSQDPLHVEHLEARLHEYYGTHAEKAACLLDIVAEAGSGVITFDEIARIAGTKRSDLESDEIRTLLGLLQRDHYLVREGNGFRFRLELLRTVWRHMRFID